MEEANEILVPKVEEEKYLTIEAPAKTPPIKLEEVPTKPPTEPTESVEQQLKKKV
jgi:hypothetical protein